VAWVEALVFPGKEIDDAALAPAIEDLRQAIATTCDELKAARPG